MAFPYRRQELFLTFYRQYDKEARATTAPCPSGTEITATTLKTSNSAMSLCSGFTISKAPTKALASASVSATSLSGASCSSIGEDTPQDNAVLSRCTVIQVSAYQRDDTLLNRMLDLVRYFPAMGLHFLQKKQREGSDELLSQIFKIQEELEQAGIDARLAKNTAVFAGSFLYGFGKYLTQEEIEEFMAWLRLRTEETKEITESEHSVAQFFSDMTVMMADGKVQQGHHFFVADGYIYLWFKACYDAWRQEYRDVVQRAVLAAYFDKEPFCVKRNHPYRMSAQVGVVKTTVLDYKRIPDEDFRSFCEALDEEEEF